MTQERLAFAIFNFMKNAKLRETANSLLTGKISNNLIERFIRAEIYIIIVSTMNYYQDKMNVIHYILKFVFEEFYLNEFNDYKDFKNFFNSDFKNFEDFMRMGEKTGNGILFGISAWVLDEPKGSIDLINQMEITPYLFTVFEQINKTHFKLGKKIKVID